MSFGTSGWGVSGWGDVGVSSAGISVSGAVAVSTKVVRVTLSAPPKNSNSVTRGDALNPRTWTVQRLDTSAFFTVLGVSKVNPTVYDVLVYEPFAAVLVSHMVSSTTLVAATGELVTAPTFATFAGLIDKSVATPQAQTAQRRLTIRDIANPPLPKAGSSLAGTFVINGSGDYSFDEGTELLRKLIIRRLITKKGEFFHLPAYGIGIREKEPIPGSLLTLQAEIERQVRLEPEVDAVKVKLLQDRNVLTVQLSAKLRKTGGQVEITFASQTEEVAF